MTPHIETSEEFAKLIGNNEKVLIDFWAPWCGPCQAFTPIFDAVAEQISPDVITVKANVDELPAVAQKYGVRTIPTVLFLKNGEIKAQNSGLISKQALLSLTQ